jgi:hypothetical protein
MEPKYILWTPPVAVGIVHEELSRSIRSTRAVAQLLPAACRGSSARTSALGNEIRKV